MRVTVFSTGGKFRRFNFYVVTCSYSSHLFLCTFVERYVDQHAVASTVIIPEYNYDADIKDAVQKLEIEDVRM